MKTFEQRLSEAEWWIAAQHEEILRLGRLAQAQDKEIRRLHEVVHRLAWFRRLFRRVGKMFLSDPLKLTMAGAGLAAWAMGKITWQQLQTLWGTPGVN